MAPQTDSRAEEAEALGSRASLERAGFGASKRDQDRFLGRVITRQAGRPELPEKRGVLHIAGAALAASFGVLLASRGLGAETIAAGGAAIAHAALAARSYLAQRARSQKDAPPEPDACYRDDRGQLVPALGPNERVLLAFDADGPERKRLRTISGFAFAFWGVLLGGLPFALVAGGGPIALAIAGLACFLGTAVFGRGVRSLTSMASVERFAITNERIVAMAAPGAAQSIPLTALRHRPVVVARGEGRATVALDLRPLASASPLSFMGLYGLHEVDEPRAKEIAGTVMDARRELLGASRGKGSA